MTIESSIFSQVVGKCKDGDRRAEADDFDGAIKLYKEAIMLLPPPPTSWSIGVTAFAALGDAHFWKQDYEAAREAFKEALMGDEGEDNPFIHLRMGQCLHHLGEAEDVKFHLLQAYRMAGKEIFEGEEEYLELIADRV